MGVVQGSIPCKSILFAIPVLWDLLLVAVLFVVMMWDTIFFLIFGQSGENLYILHRSRT
jgi:hypothetical protein